MNRPNGGGPLGSGLFEDPEVAASFGAELFTGQMLRFERAWSAALASCGVVEPDHGAAALAAIDGNPPELAILGLTRTEIRPVWSEDTFIPVPFVPLDLSYDHRVLNGADAARVLAHYAALVEDPTRLVVPRQGASEGAR